MSEKRDVSGVVQILIAAILFSFSGLLTKWMPWSGLSLAGARAVFAVLVMGICRGSYRVRLTGANMLAGASVMLTSVLFMIANKMTTAANAIVLQYAMPIFVILLCVIAYHQKPTKRDLLTVFFVLCEVILCFTDSLGGGSIGGDLVAILSAITYSVVFFAARLPGCSPREYTYIGNLLSCPLVLCMAFDPAVSWGEPIPYIIAGVMGLFLSAGYMFFSAGIVKVPPVTAAILCNIEPVLNPIWVFLALGEMPGIPAILGAFVVLTTVTLYSLTGAKKQSRPSARA